MLAKQSRSELADTFQKASKGILSALQIPIGMRFGRKQALGIAGMVFAVAGGIAWFYGQYPSGIIAVGRAPWP